MNHSSVTTKQLEEINYVNKPSFTGIFHGYLVYICSKCSYLHWERNSQ